MLTRLLKTALERPTAVSMCALAVLVTGAVSLTRLPLALTPDVSFPRLSIVTDWPHSSPEAIEALVTAPVEAAAGTVAGVRKVDSVTEEGVSTVNVVFRRGTDMEFAALELSETLSLLKDELPFGVSPPRIRNYVPDEFKAGRFLSYHVTGARSAYEIRRLAVERIRPALLAVDGVAEVQVLGGPERELAIELDPAKLEMYNISAETVHQALQDLDVRTASGAVRSGGLKHDLIVAQRIDGIEQIKQLGLAANTSQVVRLGDVAQVAFAEQEMRKLTRIDGNPAIVLTIEKEIDANTVTVAERVFDKLHELETVLPPALRLIKERDQSERIRAELTNLSSRAAVCLVVIFLVLLAFLRNWRSPLIILASIFFSVLLAVNFFYFLDMGLNLVTLAGLALGFGMMVDNSIVVLDNVLRKYGRGHATLVAGQEGTREVVLPVLAATLTTIAVLIPFVYLTGELRLYYLPFAVAVGVSLLASLLVAFTFTPTIAIRMVSADHVDRNSGFGQNLYARLLRFLLRYRLATMVATLAVFAASYILFDRYVTKGRIWSWGEDTFLVVTVRMPPGAELERADAIARMFEQHVAGEAKIKRVFTTVSREFARIDLTFPEPVKSSAFPLLLKEKLTYLATQIAGPAVGVYGYGPGFFSGGGAAPRYRLQLLGYNYKEVKRLASEVGARLARHPRVRNVDSNYSFRFSGDDDLIEMVLKIDPANLQRYRFASGEVLTSVQDYLRENLSWQRIKIAGQEIEYRVKMRGHRTFDLEGLERLVFTTPANERVRLSEIAHLEARKVMPQIVRDEQQYSRWIAFEYRGPWKFGNRLVESVVKSTALPPGYKLQRDRYYFLREQEKSQITWALVLAVALVYLVTGALFDSFRLPLVILLSAPLALLGVFCIFYLTGTNFDRSAYIGLILLAGIVVNNSILIVYHIHDLHRQGAPLLEAVVRGAQDRVRPILMTSATTVFGLLPLVFFARPEQSIWYTLSLTTIGGLASSTLLVLLVIPVLFSLLARRIPEQSFAVDALS